MSDELPEGWASARLCEVAQLVGGAGFPIEHQNKRGRPFPFFKVGNLVEVGSGQKLVDSKHTVDAEVVRALGAKVIPADSVVFAKIGMAIRLNRRRLLGVPACIDNNMMAAIPTTAIAARYLHRFLESVDLMPLTQATTVPSLSRAALASIVLPLPPVAEQRRIVAKLEELLGKVGNCQKRLARIPVLLKRFRQAVLGAACSGRLTEDWREENAGAMLDDICPPADAPEVPSSWMWKRLSDISRIRGGVTKGRNLAGKTKVLLPYLRVANVQDGFLDLREVKQIEAVPGDLEKYRLESGDILFTEGGDRDKLGRGTVWAGEIPDCIHQNHIFRARLITDEVIPEYVSLASKTEFSRSYFFEKANQTVNLASINLTTLSSLPLAIPPIAEQREITRRFGALLASADQIAARFTNAQAQVDRLAPSLLVKAFRGDLVPTEAELARREGRSFEPAEVLLERGQIATKPASPRRRGALG